MQEPRGIIYLSKIPPYMSYKKIRKLFSEFGETDNIYLAPEPRINRKRRIQAGGNKRKCYVEGWIEFISKKVAKTVANNFNNATTGGKKRHNFYRDDIWSIKYLSKFTWEHLKTKIEFDTHTAEQEIRNDITNERKAGRFFAKQVEKAREIECIKKKRKTSKGEVFIRDFPQVKPVD
jgi:ESF2/ABP1 family protein